MLTTVMNNLHKKYPDAEMNIASSKWIDNLLPYLPFINKAVVFNAPYEKNTFRKIYETLKFIVVLRKEKYDMAFLSNRHNFYGLILKLAGIKYRLGFKETKYLTHTAPFDHNVHFTDRHNKILSANGIETEDSNLILKRKLSREEILNKNNLAGKKFIIGIFPFGGVNPGTNMAIKQWEYSKYIELISRLAESHKDITIIFFEGYREQEIVPDNFKFENVIKLKINFDLISTCNLFMACDTGPLYVAESFGISTMSIFGPSDAEKGGAPKSKTEGVIHKVIWKKPACSPCYTTVTAFERSNPKYWNGITFLCNTGTHECIKSVSVDEVKNILDGMISEILKTNSFPIP